VMIKVGGCSELHSEVGGVQSLSGLGVMRVMDCVLVGAPSCTRR